MRISTWVLRELEDQITRTLRNCTSFIKLKKIHAHILVSSLSQSNFLATQVINICNANRRVDYAALVFKQVCEPNVFLYNSMIRAYTQNHHYTEAVSLYRQMLWHSHVQIPVSTDRFTYPFVLKACAGLLFIDLGKQVHTHIFKSGLDSNSITQNSLIEMYTKCDDVNNAHKVFDEMKERDVVSWNTLISAHARLGQMRRAKTLFNLMPDKTVVSWTALISGYASTRRYSNAVDVFHQMQLAGFEPDDISIISVLPACAQLGALELGRWIHLFAEKHGLLRKTFVSNALIEMYAKCGIIDQARHLFDEMPQRDVISWSTMIGGLATHGRPREAIQLFVKMASQKTVRPNSIVFLGLLSACAHGGLLSEGLQFFNSMKEDYGLDPGIEHYGCMVDLLGRSGCIDRAVKIINSMPMPADATIWGSLLSACRAHGDIETAIKAMERLVELEPEDSGNYVLLSNICAASGRWDAVASMRRLMRNRSMKKTPGCSLIEVNNEVREFVAGDKLSTGFDELYRMLDLLALQLGKIRVLSAMDAELQSKSMGSSSLEFYATAGEHQDDSL